MGQREEEEEKTFSKDQRKQHREQHQRGASWSFMVSLQGKKEGTMQQPAWRSSSGDARKATGECGRQAG